MIHPPTCWGLWRSAALGAAIALLAAGCASGEGNGGQRTTGEAANASQPPGIFASAPASAAASPAPAASSPAAGGAVPDGAGATSGPTAPGADGAAPAETARPSAGAPAAVPPSASAPGGREAADGAAEHAYSAETLLQGLDVPWDIAFAPDGRLFFTERPGKLRVVDQGVLRDKPLYEVPAPFVSEGEGGLLGLALHPDFENNAFAYVYHTYKEADGGQIRNRVLRLKIGGERAALDRIILDGIPGGVNHNGGRIRFGPDGMLYVTTGDRYEPELAQDRESLGGKILRIAPDGSIPADNPWPGSPVYSLGHRNPQGLAWHPETGELYASEHGQSAHDEINRIEAGGNYGWPRIEGDETGGRLKPPLLHSGEDTWAPSGMTFVSKGELSGRLLVANLAGRQLLEVMPERENREESGASARRLFPDEWGRLRAVAEAPDGRLYVLTNNRDGRGNPGATDDRIIVLTPGEGAGS